VLGLTAAEAMQSVPNLERKVFPHVARSWRRRPATLRTHRVLAAGHPCEERMPPDDLAAPSDPHSGRSPQLRCRAFHPKETRMGLNVEHPPFHSVRLAAALAGGGPFYGGYEAALEVWMP